MPLPSGSLTTTATATTVPSWRMMVIYRLLIQIGVHILCLVLYLIPIFTPNEFNGPTLDEIHIMSPDNNDIHGSRTTLRQILSNDYWGRSMHAENSHKSWRPLTVLSFRYLKGWDWSNQQLLVHRIVNIITHATTAEIVGIVAVQLWKTSLLLEPVVAEAENQADDEDEDGDSRSIANNATQQQQDDDEVTSSTDDDNTEKEKRRHRQKRQHRRQKQLTQDEVLNRYLLLQVLVKIVFALHPTHIEVTANAANRNHILAVLCSVILCSPTTPTLLWITTLVCGYLSSETFLFQIPPVMVTIVVIAYHNNNNNNTIQKTKDGQQRNNKTPSSLWQVLWQYIFAVISQLPRIVLLGSSIGLYYGGRVYYDTLDIPKGLIRPAENPFYTLEGYSRIINYAYILAVHIAKSIPGCDPIGFSHEYGYDCIPVMNNDDDMNDTRFFLVYGIGMVLIASLFVAFIYNPHKYFGIVAVYWSWTFITLFPISGFLKVGTFVSDRIVVASTVPVSWILGRVLYSYLTKWFWIWPARPLQMAVLSWCFVTSYMTVHNRALQWMDSISLLNSSLETCPRFAKAHMEVSKIHSGLYPTLLDLDKSRRHLETAREIDPDMCDVHQQFAYVAIQEGKYKEYEEELTHAVLCPFTMGGAFPMWQQYWKIAIDSTPPGTPQRNDVETRHAHYTRIIQQAVREAQEKEAAEEAAAAAAAMD